MLLALAAGLLTGCGGPAAVVTPAEQTGPNGVNLDGAIVNRGTLKATCSLYSQDQDYRISAYWDDSPGFYTFEIVIKPFKGPGTFLAKDFAYVMPFSRANGSLVAQGSTAYQAADVLGSVTVNGDQKSGRFDQNFLTADKQKFRLHGSWQCADLQH